MGIAAILRLLSHGGRTSACLKGQRLRQFLRGEREKDITAPRSTPNLAVYRGSSLSSPHKTCWFLEASAPISWSFLQVQSFVFREMGKKQKRKEKAFPHHKKLRTQRETRLSTRTERQPLSQQLSLPLNSPKHTQLLTFANPLNSFLYMPLSSLKHLWSGQVQFSIVLLHKFLHR